MKSFKCKICNLDLSQNKGIDNYIVYNCICNEYILYYDKLIKMVTHEYFHISNRICVSHLTKTASINYKFYNFYKSYDDISYKYIQNIIKLINLY